MKKINWIVVVFIGLLFANIAYADIDPWYLNNPSCVIDRGNPARTGEYLTQPVEKFHGISGTMVVNGIATPTCYGKIMISGGPTTWNLETMKKVWQANKNEKYFSSGYIVYKNRIYAISANEKNYLHIGAYDLKTGKQIFNFDKHESLSRAQGINLLIYNDIWYIPTDKEIIAYDLNNSKIIWRLPFITNRFTTDGDSLYFSDWAKKNIVAVDLKSGKLIWKINREANGYLSVSKNIIVFSTSESNTHYSKPWNRLNYFIYAVNAQDGKFLWKYPEDIVMNDESVAISKGRVFFEQYNKLIALDLKTGKKLWEFPRHLTEKPSVASNIVYVRNPNFIYAVDAITGKLKSKYLAETSHDIDGFLGSIVPYNKRLFVNCVHPKFVKLVVLN